MLLSRWNAMLLVLAMAASARAGLIAYWNFDETSGVIAADASGHEATGTLQGATPVAGKFGGALSFDGNDQVLIANVAAAFASLTTQATVAFWQYGADAQPVSDTIFSGKAGGSRVLQSHLPWGDGNVYWDAGNSYDRISKAASAANYKGAWNHWAFTKNATTGVMKVYLNGAEWNSGTGKTLSMAGINAFAVGSEIGSNYYRGSIDEFAVWNEVLAPTQISGLASATHAMTITAPTFTTSLTNSAGTLSPGGDGAIGTTTFGYSSANIAPAGIASQSSTGYGGIASRANDGNTNGNWGNGSVTHTLGQDDPWWQVDLGGLKAIDSISLWNRTDCCGGRLTNFHVAVLSDPTTEVWGADYFTAGGYPNPNLDIPVPAGTEGRYVRIQRYTDAPYDDNDALSLAEVLVLSEGGTLDYVQGPDAVLAIDIDAASDAADQLIVSGLLKLDGELRVSLIGGSLQAFDSFDILDWGTLEGEFDAIVLPGLPQHRHWDLSALYTTGEISVGVPEPATLTLLALGALGLLSRRRRRP